MRLSKKVLLVSLVLVLAAGMVFVGCAKDTAKKQGKVLTIYCWNDEFQSRFNDYFAAKGLVPDGIEVN
ncbi:MAG TPA: carbohydrate ABC transporter substrate-binding protein, partial [Treponemataceae bacterium]|nr:carbohydrate ABC transporter substrate-binding protein [Treponemataceae bacterium]